MWTWPEVASHTQTVDGVNEESCFAELFSFVFWMVCLFVLLGLFIYLCLFVCLLFQNRISLYNPKCRGTSSVDQANLVLKGCIWKLNCKYRQAYYREAAGSRYRAS